MEKNCLHCHFFCKQNAPCKKYMSCAICSLSNNERELIRSNPGAVDDYGTNTPTNSLFCYMGNWSKEPGSFFSSFDKTTLSRKRDNCCYFMPHKSDIELLAGVKFIR